MKPFVALILAATTILAGEVWRPEDSKCPYVHRRLVFSSNREIYKLFCGRWMDNEVVLNMTHTGRGYPDCLSDCDATPGCRSVQYIATDIDQDQGGCTMFPTDEQMRIGDSNSWVIAVPIP